MKTTSYLIPFSAFILFSSCSTNAVTVNKNFDFKKVKRIAVLDFEPVSGNKSSGEMMGRIFEKLLMEAGFTLIDRQDVKKVMIEQNFQSSGAVTPEQAVKIGNILGVDAVVTGQATVYTPDESSVVMVDIFSDTREPVLEKKEIEYLKGDKKVREIHEVVVDYKVTREKRTVPQVYRIQAQAGMVVKMVDVQTGEIAWVGSATDEGMNVQSAAESAARDIVHSLTKILKQSEKRE
ncbi:MAG: hypothetical protein KCHDKBKB_02675 [Elusimicrobia bacterium]|nr:hypothetical protein [Elusimicrobiota bacterium]